MKDRRGLDKIAGITGSGMKSRDVLKEFLGTIDTTDDRILREDVNYTQEDMDDADTEFDMVEEIAKAISRVGDRFFDPDDGEYADAPFDLGKIWRQGVEKAENLNPYLDMILSGK